MSTTLKYIKHRQEFNASAKLFAEQAKKAEDQKLATAFLHILAIWEEVNHLQFNAPPVLFKTPTAPAIECLRDITQQSIHFIDGWSLRVSSNKDIGLGADVFVYQVSIMNAPVSNLNRDEAEKAFLDYLATVVAPGQL